VAAGKASLLYLKSTRALSPGLMSGTVVSPSTLLRSILSMFSYAFKFSCDFSFLLSQYPFFSLLFFLSGYVNTLPDSVFPADTQKNSVFVASLLPSHKALLFTQHSGLFFFQSIVPTIAQGPPFSWWGVLSILSSENKKAAVFVEWIVCLPGVLSIVPMF